MLPQYMALTLAADQKPNSDKPLVCSLNAWLLTLSLSQGTCICSRSSTSLAPGIIGYFAGTYLEVGEHAVVLVFLFLQHGYISSK